MLADLLQELHDASTAKEKEKIYKVLEKVGMDRNTANFLIQYYRKKEQKHGQ